MTSLLILSMTLRCHAAASTGTCARRGLLPTLVGAQWR
jgi:hypothetical protein